MRLPCSYRLSLRLAYALIITLASGCAHAGALAAGQDNAALGSDSRPPQACSEVAIGVVGASIREHEIICAGVLRSIELFRQCRLQTPERVRIILTRAPLQVSGIPALGLYDANAKTIRLVDLETFAEMARKMEEFDALPIEALYESVVAHEVAHRIFRALVKDKSLSHATHEYVAYAAQISAMPRKVRRQYLKSINRPPPSDLSLFVDIVLLFGPARYSAMAYDHFASPQNGCRILRGIVSGKITFPTMDEFD